MSLRAIDADGHLIEWPIDWQARMPVEFRHRGPQIIKDHDGQGRIIMDGVALPNPMYEGQGRWVSNLVRVDANPNGMVDPHARIPDMDLEGIDQAVLFGSIALFHANSTSDWRFAAALTRVFNDWIAEYCTPYPDRLRFVAVVPLGDIGAAVEEATRAVKDLGAVAVALPVNYWGRSLDNPYFDRLYGALQELDVPACVHGSTGSSKFVQTVGAHENWLITHALAFPMGLTHALASIVCGGVMTRFPRLRVGFFEGGCGWLPFYMERLDEHVEKLPTLVPWLDQPPSAFIKGDRFFISCEPEEDLGHVLEAVGEDQIVYASDYAHWDCEFPNSVRAIAERPALTETQKHKILRDNAGRLYKLRVPVTA